MAGLNILQICSLSVILLSSGAFSNLRQDNSPWTWKCEQKLCQKVEKSTFPSGTPMDICKLNCDDVGSLLPLPTGNVSIGKGLVPLYPSGVSFNGFNNLTALKSMLDEVTGQIFKGYLLKMHPDYDGTDQFPVDGPYKDNKLVVTISIAIDNDSQTLSTDETYSLVFSSTDNISVMATISSQTYYGARHALETLSQLIAYDETKNSLQIVNSASVQDGPVYKYRGISLDTSRNYYPVQNIKNIIDGLSYNKLNIFHWHITDTHSFPMEVKGRPEMTHFGAYSQREVYSFDQMKELVRYARVRGVKIVPEFDEPAHVGHGWQWGPSQGMGDLVVCLDKEPWFDFCVEPPCGQLNLANPKMYDVLEGIYTSMFEIFDKDLFHMGGDEVDFRCYNSSQEILQWMANRTISTNKEGFLQIWGEFQMQAHDLIKKVSPTSNVTSILWTSELTHDIKTEEYLSQDDYIIQIWSASDSEMIPFLLNKGYRTIFSNFDAMYLDCGVGSWIGNKGHNWCSPYKSWQTIYDNNPYKIYANLTNTTMADEAMRKGLLLGAETALWSEQADELSVEGKIFPRASALAERMWSNPSTESDVAELRMVTNRRRYEQRGIKAERIQPEWCSQNQMKCNAPPAPDDGTTPLTTTTTTTTTPTTTITPKPNSGPHLLSWNLLTFAAVIFFNGSLTSRVFQS